MFTVINFHEVEQVVEVKFELRLPFFNFSAFSTIPQCTCDIYLKLFRMRAILPVTLSFAYRLVTIVWFISEM